jgi:hydroxyacylglutathione hydrolase
VIFFLSATRVGLICWKPRSGSPVLRKKETQQLYSSLRLIANLPCHVQILPTHESGSACGKSLGAVHSSTAGHGIKFNPTLKFAMEGPAQAFVDLILRNPPRPPFYSARIKNVNRGGPAVPGRMPEPRQLTIDDVIGLLDDPTLVVLDTRADRAAFMKAHLRGSLYAPAKGSYFQDSLASGAGSLSSLHSFTSA